MENISHTYSQPYYPYRYKGILDVKKSMALFEEYTKNSVAWTSLFHQKIEKAGFKTLTTFSSYLSSYRSMKRKCDNELDKLLDLVEKINRLEPKSAERRALEEPMYQSDTDKHKLNTNHLIVMNMLCTEEARDFFQPEKLLLANAPPPDDSDPLAYIPQLAPDEQLFQEMGPIEFPVQDVLCTEPQEVDHKRKYLFEFFNEHYQKKLLKEKEVSQLLPTLGVKTFQILKKFYNIYSYFRRNYEVNDLIDKARECQGYVKKGCFWAGSYRMTFHLDKEQSVCSTYVSFFQQLCSKEGIAHLQNLQSTSIKNFQWLYRSDINPTKALELFEQVKGEVVGESPSLRKEMVNAGIGAYKTFRAYLLAYRFLRQHCSVTALLNLIEKAKIERNSHSRKFIPWTERATELIKRSGKTDKNIPFSAIAVLSILMTAEGENFIMKLDDNNSNDEESLSKRLKVDSF